MANLQGLEPFVGGFPGRGEPAVTVRFTLDGETHDITADPSMAALRAIRDVFGYTRPKRGCQAGICGKCESDVDGALTRLCITELREIDGTTVTTPVPKKSIWSV